MPSFSGLCVKPSLMYHRPFVVCGVCVVAVSSPPVLTHKVDINLVTFVYKPTCLGSGTEW